MANSRGDVDGLAGDGGIRSVDEHQDLGAHLMKEPVGIVNRDLDAHTRLAGDDHVVEIMIVLNVADDVEGV